MEFEYTDTNLFDISYIRTKPDFNPQKIFKEHNRVELDYFVNVGFKNDNVNKQTENIEVSIIGTPQKSDIMLIDTIIAELKPLIFPIDIKRVEKGGDLLIYLTPDYKGSVPDARGVTYIYINLKIFGVNLHKTSIWISPKISGIERESVFRHEFCHALGFSHPTIVNKEYSKSVMSTKDYFDFNNNSKEMEPMNYHFSEIDKAVIRILYDKEIPNGLSKKSFINLYEKFKKNDVYQQGNLIRNP